MRRARGSRGPAFSLFSFQDILTTTIGVVLLVMLQLVLGISFETATAVAATESTSKPDAAPLDEDQLRQEVMRLNRLLTAAKEHGAAAAVQQLRDWTQQDEVNAEQALLDAQAAREQAQASQPERIAILKALHADIEEQNAEVLELRDALGAAWDDPDKIQELQELRGETGRLQRQHEGLLSNDALVYIQSKNKATHEAILVEIAKDWIKVHAHGIAPGMPLIEFSQSDVDTRCQSAVELLVQLSNTRRYPFLVVQPSGAEPYRRIDEGRGISPARMVQQLLRDRKIAVGMDLLWGGKTTVPADVLPGAAP